MLSKLNHALSLSSIFYGSITIFLFLTMSVSMILVSIRSEHSLSKLQKETTKAEVKLAAQHIEQFLDTRVQVLKDLSIQSVVSNGVMQSNIQQANLHDFIKNYKILGQDDHLFITNIVGGVITTNYSHGDDESFGSKVWFQDILDGKIDRHIYLDNHKDKRIFVIAVPILYDANVEGVLVAEIYTDLKDIFGPLLENSHGLVQLTDTENNIEFRSRYDDHHLYTSIHSRLIADTAILFDYQINEIFLSNQRTGFVIDIGASLTLSIILSFILIVLFGRSVILNPYKALEQSEKSLRLYESAFRHSNDGILITDNKDVIISVNDAMVRISGYSKDELIGKTPDIFYGKDSDPFARQKIRKALDEEKIYTGRILNYSKDGHQYWLELSICPIYNDQGKVTHFASIERDITQLIEDQKKLSEYAKEMEAAKLEADSANKMKSDFLANMSHEIRTPMNGIIGTTSLLEDTTLQDKQRKYVQTIKNSGLSLLVILNEILDFSSLEAGEINIVNEPYDIRKTSEDIIDLFTVPAQDKNLDLHNDIDDKFPQYLMGDPGRVRQVIINLTNNALKFTDAGSIIISIEKNNDRSFTVRVKDTGIGIPEHKHADIFKAFSQADNSSIRKAGGTGLGLSICKGLIEKMGGEIGFDSAEGLGSCFWFTLPFIEPSESETRDLAMQQINEQKILEHKYNGAKILLVEDVQVNVFIINEMLTEFDCIIEHAENGMVAVQMAKDNDYDIILMDCQMPVMDGFEATKAIVKFDKKTPILALTANVLTEEKEKCYASGMVDFISKPVTKTSLGIALNSWLNKGKKVNKA